MLAEINPGENAGTDLLNLPVDLQGFAEKMLMVSFQNLEALYEASRMART